MNRLRPLLAVLAAALPASGGRTASSGSLRSALAAAALSAALVPPAFAAPPPKLVVLVVVDQLRADFYDRFSKHMTGGGFSELFTHGANYQMAFYEHATTYTGPGHALLGSGQYGQVTGIVGNDWYDRASRRTLYCVEDPLVRASTPTEQGYSPRLFEGRSLADRVKQKYPRARVVGVSLKDRSAILMVGQKADAAYWFKSQIGLFVSSSYYRWKPEVLAFNEGLEAFAAVRATWTWSVAASTAQVCGGDLPEHHSDSFGLGKTFPHPVGSFRALVNTPFGNDLLEEFAAHVLDVYDLGRNPSGQPDVLAVSFSAYDYMSHNFGTDSCELADAAVRLDKTLDRFLQRLQAKVQKKDLLVILTSDHGGARIPELVRAEGGDAGRVNLFYKGEKKLSKLPPLRKSLEQAAAKQFQYAAEEDGPFLIADFQEPCFYIDPKGSGKGREDAASVWLKQWLERQEGVQSVHTRDEIVAKLATIPRSLALSFRPDRSGDVCAILKPEWQWTEFPTGTSHGQPHPYDQHVPLVVWGRAIAAGDHMVRVSTARIAPAIARFLGLSLEGYADPGPLPGLTP